MAKSLKKSKWVTYNVKTHSYGTFDGTSVAAELVDHARTPVDYIRIALICLKQRIVRIFNFLKR